MSKNVGIMIETPETEESLFNEILKDERDENNTIYGIIRGNDVSVNEP